MPHLRLRSGMRLVWAVISISSSMESNKGSVPYCNFHLTHGRLLAVASKVTITCPGCTGSATGASGLSNRSGANIIPTTGLHCDIPAAFETAAVKQYLDPDQS